MRTVTPFIGGGGYPLIEQTNATSATITGAGQQIVLPFSIEPQVFSSDAFVQAYPCVVSACVAHDSNTRISYQLDFVSAAGVAYTLGIFCSGQSVATALGSSWSLTNAVALGAPVASRQAFGALVLTVLSVTGTPGGTARLAAGVGFLYRVNDSVNAGTRKSFGCASCQSAACPTCGGSGNGN